MTSAAGIACTYEGGVITVPPAIEAVLGWTVREGVTNVIRHSRARSCTIRVRQDAARVGIEIVDDGAGATAITGAATWSASENGGNGLSGPAAPGAPLCRTVEPAPRP